MTIQERLAVKAAWIKLSAYYQVQLQDHVLEMYAEDVEDLSFRDVMAALTAYRRNHKNVRVPLPAAIRAIAKPEISDEVLAIEATSRVSYAIKSFGYSNQADAKAYIGGLGWHVVERCGGWLFVCQNLGTHVLNIGTFQAQFRENAKAQLQLSRAGRLEEGTKLSQGKNDVAKLIGSYIRTIDGDK